MYKQEQASITEKTEFMAIIIRIADRLSDYKYIQDDIFACFQTNRKSGGFS
jgi:hypothetical protein